MDEQRAKDNYEKLIREFEKTAEDKIKELEVKIAEQNNIIYFCTIMEEFYSNGNINKFLISYNSHIKDKNYKPVFCFELSTALACLSYLNKFNRTHTDNFNYYREYILSQDSKDEVFEIKATAKAYLDKLNEEKKPIEKKLKEKKYKPDFLAEYIASSSLSDEEKLEVIKYLAKQSCEEVVLVKEEEKVTLSDEEKDKYQKLIDEIHQILFKKYDKYVGKNQSQILQKKSFVEIIIKFRENEGYQKEIENIKSNPDYIGVILELLLKYKIELQNILKQNEYDELDIEELEVLYNLLLEYINIYKSYDEIKEEEKQEEKSEPYQVVYLTDSNNNFVVDLNSLETASIEPAAEIINNKLKKGLFDYKKGKNNSKLQNRSSKLYVWLNKSGNGKNGSIACAYVKLTDEIVLVIAIGKLSNDAIYEVAKKIVKDYEKIITGLMEEAKANPEKFLQDKRPISEEVERKIGITKIGGAKAW